jgi:hypothetical protein
MVAKRNNAKYCTDFSQSQISHNPTEEHQFGPFVKDDDQKDTKWTPIATKLELLKTRQKMLQLEKKNHLNPTLDVGERTKTRWPNFWEATARICLSLLQPVSSPTPFFFPKHEV